MQQHLVEHAAEDIAVALVGSGGLDRLGDGAAEGAGGAGVLGQDLAADLGLHGGARRHGGAVGAHDLAAEGLLLIGALDHEDLAVEAQIGAGHGERGAPLSGAGLGGDAAQALILGVIRLGHGGVELVRAGGVVALELVVDVRRGAQLLLEAVGANKGRGAVHLVEVAYLLRYGDLAGVVVELLADELVAEDGLQVLELHGLARGGVAQRGGLILHIGADVVPRPGHLLFTEINFVRDLRFGHGVILLFRIKKVPSDLKDHLGQINIICGATQIAETCSAGSARAITRRRCNGRTPGS